MTDHTDLIARLEAAPQGSRELCGEIALALGCGPDMARALLTG